MFPLNYINLRLKRWLILINLVNVTLLIYVSAFTSYGAQQICQKCCWGKNLNSSNGEGMTSVSEYVDYPK